MTDDNESTPILNKKSSKESNKHKCFKAIISLLAGFGLGVVFYHLILVDLNFTRHASLVAGAIISTSLGIGCAISTQIRCITALTLPSFGGKVGRSVMKTLVIAYILSGPVTNTTDNGKEVVRVFACTASLTFNLTKTRFELLIKPFTEALFGLKTDANEIKDTLRSIRDISLPIIGEVEDQKEIEKIKEENDYIDQALFVGDTSRSKDILAKYAAKGEKLEAVRYEKMYLKKIEMRCENQFSRAANKCRNMFASAYDSCYETVTWAAAWLLCWPMKLDFVCNVAQALGGSKRCDPSKDIDAGFGEGYAYLKNSRAAFASNFQNVKIQYKIDKIKDFIDIRDGREAAKALLHVVKEKKTILDQIMMITKRLLAFIFLRIIISAQNYHDKYLRDIQFDNVYITGYFRRIDARRKFSGKYTLLPLKKIERKKYLDVYSAKCLKHERRQLFQNLLVIVIEMMAASVFIILDRLFYEVLDLVRKHGRIDYTQTGRHDLKLEIKGTGMIASLLRSVVKGFNIKKRINIERSNEKCLPRPTQLSNYYLYKIYGTYFCIIMLLLVQVYTQRLRRRICSYFYRKREKTRILHIYNDMLKRRIGFFNYGTIMVLSSEDGAKLVALVEDGRSQRYVVRLLNVSQVIGQFAEDYKHMQKKVKQLIRDNRLKENYNVCAILRINYPNICNCLRVFPMARRNCLICNETEPFSNNIFVICPNKDCHLIYCRECWIDMGHICLACSVLLSDNPNLSSGNEDSASDDDKSD